jgi:uncharacterized protein YbaR (Trm112 family)
MPEINITVGTPADFDRLMPALMQAHKENGFVSANLPVIMQDLWSALHLDRGVAAFIQSPDGVIEGVLILRVCNMWYSIEDLLEEKLLYVMPECRSAKGGRARKLSDFAKSMADKMHMPLMIGVVSNERTKGKMRLYERLFGPPAGAFFLYGASTPKPTTQGA